MSTENEIKALQTKIDSMVEPKRHQILFIPGHCNQPANARLPVPPFLAICQQEAEASTASQPTTKKTKNLKKIGRTLFRITTCKAPNRRGRKNQQNTCSWCVNRRRFEIWKEFYKLKRIHDAVFSRPILWYNNWVKMGDLMVIPFGTSVRDEPAGKRAH